MASNGWGHPFEPYEIQQDFMRQAYALFEEGGVGIFESPTGTGKSLSLICSALTWLQDRLAKDEDECDADPADSSAPAAAAEPDWVESTARDMKRRQREHARELLAEQRARQLKRVRKARPLFERPAIDTAGSGAENVPHPNREPAGRPPAAAAAAAADDRFVLADVERAGRGAGSHGADALAAESDDAADADADAHAPRHAPEDEELQPPPLQVLYCSRTHSQLSQFVSEVRRTPHGEVVPTVSLGSRKQLCINERVRSLGSAARINDACATLQRAKASGGKGGGGCEFRGGASRDSARALRDRLLVEPTDLEELGALGRRARCCPYYAARAASRGAQLLAVPYSCLLHAPTREALGINIDGSVLIFDEAHNLVDAINDAHSIVLSAAQLATSHTQLSRYLRTYEDRLSPANREAVKRLLRVVSALRAAVAPAPAPPAAPAGSASAGAAGAAGAGAGTRVLRVNAFLCELRVDNINLFELMQFCSVSELAKKVQGFVDAAEGGAGVVGAGGGAGAAAPSASATYSVIALLRALTAAEADGRVLLAPAMPRELPPAAGGSGGAAPCTGRPAPPAEPPSSHGFVKYVHLNPEVHFAPVLARARALLLAGGTMEPVDELIAAILSSVQPARVRVRRFGHVVPPSNLLGACVRATSPGSPPLQLVAANRSRPDVLDAIGGALGRLRAATPGGMIVFFPSFGYAAEARARWAATGLLERALCAHGPVFDEPRDAAAVEAVLDAYGAAIRPEPRGGEAAADDRPAEPLGAGGAAPSPASAAQPAPPLGRATLFSVVGGKMSEGINFADDLGRCVVMVGLPFPNPRDPELMERMAFLNARGGGRAGGGAQTPAQRYYEALCMRAVNQSVGRVIRHAADYASVVLLDARYATPRVQHKLPGWMAPSLSRFETVDDACAAISAFFRAKGH